MITRRYYAKPTPRALHASWWCVVDQDLIEVERFYSRRSAKNATRILNQIAAENAHHETDVRA